MSRFYRLFAAAATALAMSATLTTAETAVFSAISPVELQKTLGPALSIGDQGGDTVLEGEVDDVFFSIFFYNCDGGAFDGLAKPASACLSFEYRAYFDGYPDDGETLAAFNAAHHFGALWRDPLAEEALALHMPVIVEGGVTEANIKATFRWWRETIRAFDTFMETR
ncbi:MAG: YbjN domain-containing protein [Pseudomonadota bacterium]